MRIIQIATFPTDITRIKGGVEASVYGLALEQAGKHEVVICDLPRTDILKDESSTLNMIQIVRFASHGKNNLAALSRLKEYVRFIRKQAPDICHIHTTGLFCLAVYILLRINRIPCIVTVHGLAHIEKKNLFRKKKSLKNILKYLTYSATEFLFISLCKKIIVDTQYVADAIATYRRQWKIIRQPKCIVIPQGIDNCFFALQTNPKANQLLSVATLHKRKGHLLLIDAMKLVHERYPDATLSIYGALSDQQYYDKMMHAINAQGMQSYIHVYPNAAFSDILHAYQEASLFILHSEEESQGIALCEAMATGKPIVATKSGGIPWVVADGKNGLLSDFGDIQTFTDHIIRLINDEHLRQTIEKTNKTTALQYSWVTIGEHIEKVYKEILLFQKKY
jgi:glycosyltransferase involved in cell wall biosynthesis